MGGFRVEGDLVIPVEDLLPLFRSRTLARAFAIKLATTRRLHDVGQNGRLILRPLRRAIRTEREDVGHIATRLALVETGDDLFAVLRDAAIAALTRPHEEHEPLAAVRITWNNYIRWFNTVAEGRVPEIVRFTISGPTRHGAARESGPSLSGLCVAYPGTSLYSLRLTARGTSLGELLGVPAGWV